MKKTSVYDLEKSSKHSDDCSCSDPNCQDLRLSKNSQIDEATLHEPNSNWQTDASHHSPIHDDVEQASEGDYEKTKLNTLVPGTFFSASQLAEKDQRDHETQAFETAIGSQQSSIRDYKSAKELLAQSDQDSKPTSASDKPATEGSRIQQEELEESIKEREEKGKRNLMERNSNYQGSSQEVPLNISRTLKTDDHVVHGPTEPRNSSAINYDFRSTGYSEPAPSQIKEKTQTATAGVRTPSHEEQRIKTTGLERDLAEEVNVDEAELKERQDEQGGFSDSATTAPTKAKTTPTGTTRTTQPYEEEASGQSGVSGSQTGKATTQKTVSSRSGNLRPTTTATGTKRITEPYESASEEKIAQPHDEEELVEEASWQRGVSGSQLGKTTAQKTGPSRSGTLRPKSTATGTNGTTQPYGSPNTEDVDQTYDQEEFGEEASRQSGVSGSQLGKTTAHKTGPSRSGTLRPTATATGTKRTTQSYGSANAEEVDQPYDEEEFNEEASRQTGVSASHLGKTTAQKTGPSRSGNLRSTTSAAGTKRTSQPYGSAKAEEVDQAYDEEELEEEASRQSGVSGSQLRKTTAQKMGLSRSGTLRPTATATGTKRTTQTYGSANAEEFHQAYDEEKLEEEASRQSGVSGSQLGKTRAQKMGPSRSGTHRPTATATGTKRTTQTYGSANAEEFHQAYDEEKLEEEASRQSDVSGSQWGKTTAQKTGPSRSGTHRPTASVTGTKRTTQPYGSANAEEIDQPYDEEELEEEASRQSGVSGSQLGKTTAHKTGPSRSGIHRPTATVTGTKRTTQPYGSANAEEIDQPYDEEELEEEASRQSGVLGSQLGKTTTQKTGPSRSGTHRPTPTDIGTKQTTQPYGSANAEEFDQAYDKEELEEEASRQSGVSGSQLGKTTAQKTVPSRSGTHRPAATVTGTKRTTQPYGSPNTEDVDQTFDEEEFREEASMQTGVSASELGKTTAQKTGPSRSGTHRPAATITGTKRNTQPYGSANAEEIDQPYVEEDLEEEASRQSGVSGSQLGKTTAQKTGPSRSGTHRPTATVNGEKRTTQPYGSANAEEFNQAYDEEELEEEASRQSGVSGSQLGKTTAQKTGPSRSGTHRPTATVTGTKRTTQPYGSAKAEEIDQPYDEEELEEEASRQSGVSGSQLGKTTTQKTGPSRSGTLRPTTTATGIKRTTQPFKSTDADEIDQNFEDESFEDDAVGQSGSPVQEGADLTEKSREKSTGLQKLGVTNSGILRPRTTASSQRTSDRFDLSKRPEEIDRQNDEDGFETGASGLTQYSGSRGKTAAAKKSSALKSGTLSPNTSVSKRRTENRASPTTFSGLRPSAVSKKKSGAISAKTGKLKRATSPSGSRQTAKTMDTAAADELEDDNESFGDEEAWAQSALSGSRTAAAPPSAKQSGTAKTGHLRPSKAHTARGRKKDDTDALSAKATEGEDGVDLNADEISAHSGVSGPHMASASKKKAGTLKTGSLRPSNAQSKKQRKTGQTGTVGAEANEGEDGEELADEGASVQSGLSGSRTAATSMKKSGMSNSGSLRPSKSQSATQRKIGHSRTLGAEATEGEDGEELTDEEASAQSGLSGSRTVANSMKKSGMSKTGSLRPSKSQIGTRRKTGQTGTLSAEATEGEDGEELADEETSAQSGLSGSHTVANSMKKSGMSKTGSLRPSKSQIGTQRKTGQTGTLSAEATEGEDGEELADEEASAQSGLSGSRTAATSMKKSGMSKTGSLRPSKLQTATQQKTGQSGTLGAEATEGEDGEELTDEEASAQIGLSGSRTVANSMKKSGMSKTGSLRPSKSQIGTQRKTGQTGTLSAEATEGENGEELADEEASAQSGLSGSRTAATSMEKSGMSKTGSLKPSKSQTATQQKTGQSGILGAEATEGEVGEELADEEPSAQSGLSGSHTVANSMKKSGMSKTGSLRPSKSQSATQRKTGQSGTLGAEATEGEDGEELTDEEASAQSGLSGSRTVANSMKKSGMSKTGSLRPSKSQIGTQQKTGQSGTLGAEATEGEDGEELTDEEASAQIGLSGSRTVANSMKKSGMSKTGSLRPSKSQIGTQRKTGQTGTLSAEATEGENGEELADEEASAQSGLSGSRTAATSMEKSGMSKTGSLRPSKSQCATQRKTGQSGTLGAEATEGEDGEELTDEEASAQSGLSGSRTVANSMKKSGMSKTGSLRPSKSQSATQRKTGQSGTLGAEATEGEDGEELTDEEASAQSGLSGSRTVANSMKKSGMSKTGSLRPSKSQSATQRKTGQSGTLGAEATEGEDGEELTDEEASAQSGLLGSRTVANSMKKSGMSKTGSLRPSKSQSATQRKTGQSGTLGAEATEGEDGQDLTDEEASAQSGLSGSRTVANSMKKSGMSKTGSLRPSKSQSATQRETGHSGTLGAEATEGEDGEELTDEEASAQSGLSGSRTVANSMKKSGMSKTGSLRPSKSQTATQQKTGQSGTLGAEATEGEDGEELADEEPSAQSGLSGSRTVANSMKKSGMSKTGSLRPSKSQSATQRKTGQSGRLGAEATEGEDGEELTDEEASAQSGLLGSRTVANSMKKSGMSKTGSLRPSKSQSATQRKTGQSGTLGAEATEGEDGQDLTDEEASAQSGLSGSRTVANSMKKSGMSKTGSLRPSKSQSATQRETGHSGTLGAEATEGEDGEELTDEEASAQSGLSGSRTVANSMKKSGMSKTGSLRPSKSQSATQRKTGQSGTLGAEATEGEDGEELTDEEASAQSGLLGSRTVANSMKKSGMSKTGSLRPSKSQSATQRKTGQSGTLGAEATEGEDGQDLTDEEASAQSGLSGSRTVANSMKKSDMSKTGSLRPSKSQSATQRETGHSGTLGAEATEGEDGEELTDEEASAQSGLSGSRTVANSMKKSGMSKTGSLRPSKSQTATQQKTGQSGTLGAEATEGEDGEQLTDEEASAQSGLSGSRTVANSMKKSGMSKTGSLRPSKSQSATQRKTGQSGTLGAEATEGEDGPDLTDEEASAQSGLSGSRTVANSMKKSGMSKTGSLRPSKSQTATQQKTGHSGTLGAEATEGEYGEELTDEEASAQSGLSGSRTVANSMKKSGMSKTGSLRPSKSQIGTQHKTGQAGALSAEATEGEDGEELADEEASAQSGLSGSRTAADSRTKSGMSKTGSLRPSKSQTATQQKTGQSGTLGAEATEGEDGEELTDEEASAQSGLSGSRTVANSMKKSGMSKTGSLRPSKSQSATQRKTGQSGTLGAEATEVEDGPDLTDEEASAQSGLSGSRTVANSMKKSGMSKTGSLRPSKSQTATQQKTGHSGTLGAEATEGEDGEELTYEEASAQSGLSGSRTVANSMKKSGMSKTGSLRPSKSQIGTQHKTGQAGALSAEATEGEDGEELADEEASAQSGLSGSRTAADSRTKSGMSKTGKIRPSKPQSAIQQKTGQSGTLGAEATEGEDGEELADEEASAQSGLSGSRTAATSMKKSGFSKTGKLKPSKSQTATQRKTGQNGTLGAEATEGEDGKELADEEALAQSGLSGSRTEATSMKKSGISKTGSLNLSKSQSVTQRKTGQTGTLATKATDGEDDDELADEEASAQSELSVSRTAANSLKKSGLSKTGSLSPSKSQSTTQRKTGADATEEENAEEVVNEEASDQSGLSGSRKAATSMKKSDLSKTGSLSHSKSQSAAQRKTGETGTLAAEAIEGEDGKELADEEASAQSGLSGSRAAATSMKKSGMPKTGSLRPSKSQSASQRKTGQTGILAAETSEGKDGEELADEEASAQSGFSGSRTAGNSMKKSGMSNTESLRPSKSQTATQRKTGQSGTLGAESTEGENGKELADEEASAQSGLSVSRTVANSLKKSGMSKTGSLRPSKLQTATQQKTGQSGTLAAEATEGEDGEELADEEAAAQSGLSGSRTAATSMKKSDLSKTGSLSPSKSQSATQRKTGQTGTLGAETTEEEGEELADEESKLRGMTDKKSRASDLPESGQKSEPDQDELSQRMDAALYGESITKSKPADGSATKDSKLQARGSMEASKKSSEQGSQLAGSKKISSEEEQSKQNKDELEEQPDELGQIKESKSRTTGLSAGKSTTADRESVNGSKMSAGTGKGSGTDGTSMGPKQDEEKTVGEANGSGISAGTISRSKVSDTTANRNTNLALSSIKGSQASKTAGMTDQQSASDLSKGGEKLEGADKSNEDEDKLSQRMDAALYGQDSVSKSKKLDATKSSNLESGSIKGSRLSSEKDPSQLSGTGKTSDTGQDEEELEDIEQANAAQSKTQATSSRAIKSNTLDPGSMKDSKLSDGSEKLSGTGGASIQDGTSKQNEEDEEDQANQTGVSGGTMSKSKVSDPTASKNPTTLEPSSTKGTEASKVSGKEDENSADGNFSEGADKSKEDEDNLSQRMDAALYGKDTVSKSKTADEKSGQSSNVEPQSLKGSNTSEKSDSQLSGKNSMPGGSGLSKQSQEHTDDGSEIDGQTSGTQSKSKGSDLTATIKSKSRTSGSMRPSRASGATEKKSALSDITEHSNILSGTTKTSKQSQEKPEDELNEIDQSKRTLSKSKTSDPTASQSKTLGPESITGSKVSGITDKQSGASDLSKGSKGVSGTSKGSKQSQDVPEEEMTSQSKGTLSKSKTADTTVTQSKTLGTKSVKNSQLSGMSGTTEQSDGAEKATEEDDALSKRMDAALYGDSVKKSEAADGSASKSRTLTSGAVRDSKKSGSTGKTLSGAKSVSKASKISKHSKEGLEDGPDEETGLSGGPLSKSKTIESKTSGTRKTDSLQPKTNLSADKESSHSQEFEADGKTPIKKTSRHKKESTHPSIHEGSSIDHPPSTGIDHRFSSTHTSSAPKTSKFKDSKLKSLSATKSRDGGSERKSELSADQSKSANLDPESAAMSKKSKSVMESKVGSSIGSKSPSQLSRSKIGSSIGSKSPSQKPGSHIVIDDNTSRESQSQDNKKSKRVDMTKHKTYVGESTLNSGVDLPTSERQKSSELITRPSSRGKSGSKRSNSPASARSAKRSKPGSRDNSYLDATSARSGGSSYAESSRVEPRNYSHNSLSAASASGISDASSAKRDIDYVSGSPSAYKLSHASSVDHGTPPELSARSSARGSVRESKRTLSKSVRSGVGSQLDDASKSQSQSRFSKASSQRSKSRESNQSRNSERQTETSASGSRKNSKDKKSRKK